MVVVEELFQLAGQIWDYTPKIVDVGMTHKFAGLFAAWAVARISDLAEMILAFDDDEEVDEGGGMEEEGVEEMIEEVGEVDEQLEGDWN